MNDDITAIRDELRKNLNVYTLRAFSLIRDIDNPAILDVGCGTGVPSLALVERCNGTIFAVDSDIDSVNRFREKVRILGLEERIRVAHGSVFDHSLINRKFDIVLAEGLLNVVGFEAGLAELRHYARSGGFIIIHDELKDDPGKRLIFNEQNLVLLGSFTLDENIWWNEYFACLEKRIHALEDKSQFKKDLEEIEACRRDPESCRSVYYILRSDN
ncbi:MAG TPA: class I SAM-dependent methyltransferase [Spirochaetota bacterium]|nr:class I SAM-dependent methyltransferase [Spirochaetota bacterium]